MTLSMFIGSTSKALFNHCGSLRTVAPTVHPSVALPALGHHYDPAGLLTSNIAAEEKKRKLLEI